MEKKCPFRKMTSVIDYHWEGNNHPFPATYVEDFLECVGEECMAWKSGPTEEHVPYVYNYCELTKGH